jgi:glycosyltransferase involved in cell wall biosynthesis
MINEPPKFSVIITSYNYERFVGAAIRSVLDQSHKNIECIVVDDGSTDGSLDIIRSFPGIEVVAKQNGGQASAVRAGLARASGDIVLFLDADDKLYPMACEKICAKWTADVSAVQFHLDRVDTTGWKAGTFPAEPLLENGQREFVTRHGYIPSAPMSGNAYSRRFADICLGHSLDKYRELPDYVDGYLISMAPFYGQVIAIHDALGAYLQHGANQSPAGGFKMRKVKGQLLTNIAQKEALVHHLRVFGYSKQSTKSYLSPYDWRDILLLRRGYPNEPGFPAISISEALLRGLAAFAFNSRLSMLRRVKNVLLLPILALGPRSISRKLLPET